MLLNGSTEVLLFLASFHLVTFSVFILFLPLCLSFSFYLNPFCSLAIDCDELETEIGLQSELKNSLMEIPDKAIPAKNQSLLSGHLANKLSSSFFLSFFSFFSRWRSFEKEEKIATEVTAKFLTARFSF